MKTFMVQFSAPQSFYKKQHRFQANSCNEAYELARPLRKGGWSMDWLHELNAHGQILFTTCTP